MKQNEKQAMIQTYQTQFKHYLLSNGSETEKLLLQGQRKMMELFFTEKEINAIENNVRVTNQYIKSFFENIESWITTLAKEKGEKEILFTWDIEGLNNIYDYYDIYFNEYKGFKLAIENTIQALQRVNATI